MRIYLAGTSLPSMKETFQVAESLSCRTINNILLSYYYVKQIDLKAILPLYFSQNTYLFLDSGAFSAMTQNISINVHDYARFIQANRQVITVYANLDVIKDAKGTWRNQQILEQEYGLSPLPVFHVAEPWEMLERYLERYPYIALGVAGTRSHIYMPWLVKCFKMAQHTKAVYHGFGITNWNVMKSFPWYSVDSTTWCITSRFNRFEVFEPARGVLRQVDIFSHKDAYTHTRTLRGLGVDPADLMTRTPETVTLANALNILAFIQGERWLKKRWGEVTIPERQGDTCIV